MEILLCFFMIALLLVHPGSSTKMVCASYVAICCPLWFSHALSRLLIDYKV